LLAIGWGSTGEIVRDIMRSDELRGRSIAYLHYTYLWPLRTQELQRLAKRSKRIVLVEQNYQGQLGMLIRMECGLDIPDKILKYDCRPFFYDELLSSVMDRCASTSKNEGKFPGFDYAGTSS
jgi:2-oxoglutarate/2-oxoacid ferredoxin oxidoreductase subunit alpha